MAVADYVAVNATALVVDEDASAALEIFPSRSGDDDSETLPLMHGADAAFVVVLDGGGGVFTPRHQ